MTIATNQMGAASILACCCLGRSRAPSFAFVRGSNSRLILATTFLLGILHGTALADSGEAILPNAICSTIETTARVNALPVAFFTRLIWQESRFHADAIGPLTRSGKRAEGIAQFMPGTAVERGLFEPFDPVAALPKSAEFLAELREKFGNLGLAAAAYNAGPQRVSDFLSGARGLPFETRHYVLAITGRSVDEWAAQAKTPNATAAENTSGSEGGQAAATCRDAVELLERAPPPSNVRSQAQAFPSWCKGLRHPDVSVCGSIHLIETSIRTASLGVSHSHAHPSSR
jgi:hypothetical protein